MASSTSSSKWIFQTALLLCFLSMMTEGYKCYQCAAADHSCKKGSKENLKECDCKIKVLLPFPDGSSRLIYASEGCEKETDTKNWKGCYWCQSEGSDETNKVQLSVLGCSLEKKTGCEKKTDSTGGSKVEVEVCHCDMEGCDFQNSTGNPPGNPSGNSTGTFGPKLTPKSSLLLTFPLCCIILGGTLLQIYN